MLAKRIIIGCKRKVSLVIGFSIDFMNTISDRSNNKNLCVVYCFST